MDMFEWDDKHSINKPFREAAVRWFRRWLLGIDDAPFETDFPIEKPEDLQCTTSGQVVLEFKEKTPYHYNAGRAEELAAKRVPLSAKDLQHEVRRLIALEGPVPPAPVNRGIFEPEPGIKIPSVRAGKGPRVLIAHGGGKSKAGAAIEQWTRAGREVVAIDLRGMGETEPEAPHRGLANFFTPEWKEAYISFNMNRPILGQRVRDLLSVAAALDEDGQGIELVAIGTAAPVALHAAVLDPRIRRLTLEEMVVSWTAVAKTAITHNQLSNVVPGALKTYDLPDLAAALAPRPLAIVAPRDPAGAPVTQAVLEEAYAVVRSAYGTRGDLLLSAEKAR
jgi:pimeloyl-ACP methyl ester carboxylesterase